MLWDLLMRKFFQAQKHLLQIMDNLHAQFFLCTHGVPEADCSTSLHTHSRFL